MRNATAVALLLAGAAGAYIGLIGAGDLGFKFDDSRFIPDNPSVTVWQGVTRYFTDPTTADPEHWTGIWRPLRTLDFALDWAIAGDPAGGPGTVRWFLLRSLLLHGLVAVLLLFLFERWGAPRPAALLGGFVFVLHPVQVEAVAFISSRGDLICAAFLAGALLVHFRAQRIGRRALAAAGLLLFALLGKEQAVVFPAVAFLADFFFRDERRLRTTLRRLPVYGLYLLLVALYAVAFVLLHEARDARIWHLPERWGGSLAGTFLLLSRGLVYYARLVLVPVDMAMDYYLPAPRGTDAVSLGCAAVAAGAIAWAAVRAFRRGGAVPFAVLWFAIALLPTAQIVAPIAIPTAERFLYFPLFGFAFLAGGVLKAAFARGVAGKTLAVLALVCLGAVTIETAGAWRNVDTLWTRFSDRARSPRGLQWQADGMRRRAEVLREREQALLDARRNAEAAATRLERAELLRGALSHYDRIVALWDGTPARHSSPALTVRCYRALAWFESRDLGPDSREALQRAMEDCDYVLEAWRGFPSALYARALVHLALGRLHEAAADIEGALRMLPNLDTRRNAAGIFEALAMDYNRSDETPGGNRARTFACLRRAWEVYPDPEANRGVRRALDEMEKDFASRTADLKARVRAQPEDGETWLLLASTLAAYGDYAQAGDLFADLLAEQHLGRTPDVLLPYALFFWQWRDTEEGYRKAAEVYEEILRQEPDHAEAKKGLERCRERMGGRR